MIRLVRELIIRRQSDHALTHIERRTRSIADIASEQSTDYIPDTHRATHYTDS